ncbi:MAG: hypothetical protein WBY53_17935 [Acidobacteriaceae bacterium]
MPRKSNPPSKSTPPRKPTTPIKSITLHKANKPSKSLTPRNPIPPSEPTPRQAKPKSKPPYPFVLDALDPLHPEVRRMFSGFAVYTANRLILMLRESPKSPRDNGLWLVLSETTSPADPALRRDFPSLRTIDILGGAINHWLLIPSDSPSFESESLRACDHLLHHDPRLGRIPKSRR